MNVTFLKGVSASTKSLNSNSEKLTMISRKVHRVSQFVWKKGADHNSVRRVGKVKPIYIHTHGLCPRFNLYFLAILHLFLLLRGSRPQRNIN